jgi:hypothetical protein
MGPTDESVQLDRGRGLMPGAKSWEVCLYSDFTDYEVWCKSFRSFRRALRFMKKELGSENSFYCATISNDLNSAFHTYYWNGQVIIPWEEPWVLSRRQACELEADGNDQPGLGQGTVRLVYKL